MNDYIERNDTYKALFIGEHYLYSWFEIEEKLDTIPSADVAPIKHGKWLWDEDGMDLNIGSWVCSVCHSKPETLWENKKNIDPYRKSGSHYCPNCGARMYEELATNLWVNKNEEMSKVSEMEMAYGEYLND